MIEEHIQHRWQQAIEPRKTQQEQAGIWFGRLLALMADLHGDGGCPWDREQSLASLRQYIREEAEEVCSVIDEILALENQVRLEAAFAVDNPNLPAAEDPARTPKKGKTIAHHPFHSDFDPHASASGAPFPEEISKHQQEHREALYQNLLNEIGDLLMQPVFLCEILTRMGRGGLERSAEEVVRKLIRRHPHVYGDKEVSDSTEVLHNWESIKQAEKNEGKRQT